ncbi:MAG: hypothetical protein JNM00_03405 [Flavobacteriales bacterium]|nr:hypothetical protein [Flavobacteriales bacterium]
MNTLNHSNPSLFRICGFLIVSLFLFGQRTIAQCIISNLDQNIGNYVVGHTNAGQSFTSTCDGFIYAVVVDYEIIPITSGNRILNIRDGGLPGATIIHTQTIPFSSIVVGANTFLLTTPIPINNGEVNSFEITESIPSGSSASGIAHNNPSGYEGGTAWFSGNAFPEYELTFEVTICTSSSSLEPDITELPTLSAECSLDSWDIPTASNACGVAVPGVPDMSLPISAIGAYVVTWTYDDGQGNTATQQQSVYVNDTSAPEPLLAELPFITAQCEVASLAQPLAFDECDGVISGVSDVSFPITSFGVTEVIWTFTDANQNISTQLQYVEIVDTTPPMPSTEVLPSLSGCMEVMPPFPIGLDNCSVTVLVLPDVTLPVVTPGLTTITWTFTDESGNEALQTQDVTVYTVDAGISLNGTTLESAAVGANYQWVDCGNKFDFIMGATGQSYTPEISGNYAVMVADGDCSATSDCIEVIIESITEWNRPAPKLIKITDILGRETAYQPGTLLLYMYDDGSTKRIIRFE